MNKISVTNIVLFFLIVGVEHINASPNNLRKRKATVTTTLLIDTISSILMKDDWSCCDETNEPTAVVTSTPTTLRPTSIPTTQPTYAEKKITASDGSEEDYFGSSCSMSGELIVIGAKYAGDYEGAAYLFHLDGSEMSKLTVGDDGDDDDYFGYSVSVDKKVVVGPKFSNYVRLFSLEGNYERTITCDDCVFFGRSVGTYADRVVISGAVIKEFQPPSWNLYIYTTEGELLKTIDNGDDYMYDVDISDEVIVFTTDLMTYVHSNTDPDFVEIAEISQRGYVVATSGDRVVIGDHTANNEDGSTSGDSEDNTANNSDGSAWLYETDGTFIKTLEQDIEEFGSSVDITDDKIIVGARSDDEGGGIAGSVFIYSSDGDFQEKILAPDAQSGDIFGYCTSVSGSYFVVGAPGEDDNGLSSGAAYLFPLSD